MPRALRLAMTASIWAPPYAPTNTSNVPLAAAGGTQTAFPLRTPALPAAFSAAARSDVAITRPAPPRSGNPASETAGIALGPAGPW